MELNSSINIPVNLHEPLFKLFNKYSTIQRVILFGSRARGNNRDNSDIDLAIFGLEPELNGKFVSDIDDINTLFSFDICFINNDTSNDLLNNINKEGVEIYGRG